MIIKGDNRVVPQIIKIRVHYIMVKKDGWSIGNLKCELGNYHFTHHFCIKWMLVKQVASIWYGHRGDEFWELAHFV